MEKSSVPMIFLDECLSEDANRVIEMMMNHHVARNYKSVRDIILGYDSKTKIWISKYGESLANRFDNVAGSTYSSTRSFDTSIYKDTFIKSGGMIFYDDEVFDSVRVHTDDVIKRILDSLFTISKNVIDYKYITDIIVTEWNIKNVTSVYNNNISYDIDGELHFRSIDIRESSWREFKSIIRNLRLTARDAFKVATTDFLENRADMLK